MSSLGQTKCVNPMFVVPLRKSQLNNKTMPQ